MRVRIKSPSAAMAVWSATRASGVSTDAATVGQIEAVMSAFGGGAMADRRWSRDAELSRHQLQQCRRCIRVIDSIVSGAI